MADLAQIATEAIAQSYRDQFATGSLRMSCGRCTFEQFFQVVVRDLADLAARGAGWRYDECKHYELCPRCAKTLPTPDTF